MQVMNAVGDNNTIRFIIGSLDIGGTETHLCRVLPGLQKAGYRPLVITLTHKGELAGKLEQAGIFVYQPAGWIRRIRNLPVISKILGAAFTVGYLIKTFRKNPARFTCFYLPSSYYLGMIATIITGETTNTIMFRRSLNNYQSNLFKKKFELFLHEKVGKIVGNSRAVVSQLIESEGVEPDKVTLIYNGINPGDYSLDSRREELRKKLGISTDTLILCIVANLIPYKGHIDLVNALHRVSDSLVTPWLLLAVGKDVNNRQDLVKLVEKYSLENNIKWLGQLQNVQDVYTVSDIGMLVSHQEGFSNTILEGMASGLPMIVTDVGGNAEAVLHKECGIVVRPKCPEEIAEAILKLAINKELRQKYGKAARIRAREEFSIDICVSKYVSLFSSETA